MSGRRITVYYAWSRPDETGAPLGVIKNRFPTLFESRRMLFPQCEALADPARPFGPWLVGIVSWRAVDRQRRQGRQRRYELQLQAEHEAVPDMRIGGEFAFGHCRLLGVVETLPPSQWRAIRLLKLEEMSLKEAAAETRMSVAALIVATHRAMHSLCNQLISRIGA
jgi:DNA-directed RNA polymerase specialized sigma24 family protein